MLALVLSCWLALVGNLPLWRALWTLPEAAGARGLLFSFGMGAAIAAA